MKIGIVSPYALPEKGAASMRVDSFQKHFLLNNHETKILTPFRDRGFLDKKVIRYKSFKELKKELKNFQYIIISCPSFYTAFRIIPFLKLKKIPFVLDFRDLAENSQRRANILFQLVSVKLASKVIVVTEYMKNYFVKKYKINPKKIEVVSNGVDRDIFYPTKNRIKTRKELKISARDSVLIYEGIIGDHGLREFFENLTKDILVENNIKIILAVIVGETENKTKVVLENFEKMLKKRRLREFVIIIKNSSPDKLREYISASDFGLAPIPSDINNMYRVPIKAYDYVACGIPVLAKGPVNGELEKFLKGNNYGYFSSNWKDLIKKMAKISKSKIKINKKNIETFDRKTSAKKLLAHILK